MTLCRTCTERRAAPDPGGSDPGRVLLLRVWRDPSPRARLLTVREGQGAPTTVAVADGVDDICDAVRTWLLNGI
jgi:hypothetical protein